MEEEISTKEKYCGVFTPCQNCNIETCSYDYATVDYAVFSPCRAEASRAVTSRSSPRLASPRLASPRLASPRLLCCQPTAINTWMTQEGGGSRDRVSSDATTEAFSHMSDQGFIGETEASSGVVISQFSGADSRGSFGVGEELIV
jgi:hypothetical protein